MPQDFDRPHIDLSNNVSVNVYSRPDRRMAGGATPPAREEHGRFLRQQIQAAFRQAPQSVEIQGEEQRTSGAFYEVTLHPGSKPTIMERKSNRMHIGAVRIDPETGTVRVVVFIPHASVQAVEEIFEEYATGDLTEKGQKPPKSDFVAPINSIRLARLEDFWTDDPAALPRAANDQLWWEVWCAPERVGEVAQIFQRLNCFVADDHQWLQFPEAMVLPVFARRVDMELATIISSGIQELRRGSDTPAFFVEDERERQREWVENLAERVTWPGTDVPRVCLLDTGVNRAHPLIEPALDAASLLTVRPEWNTTDNLADAPHGTGMAGLALFGDLFPALQDQREIELSHRLESVRIIPDGGFPPNEPSRYGVITLDGIATAEAANPEHSRVFSLAITNEDRSGDRNTTWSACIDRAAYGGLAGDEADRPRRLVFVSAGNIRTMDPAALDDISQFPIEDPAQAWNAITVGGYTEKTVIDPTETYFANHRAYAAVGEVSPFSRTSLGWNSSKTPIKPEIVFEAGNRVISDSGREIINCDSLELLTTGADVDQRPLETFAATSAATAQAARFAARLSAEHSDLWPETLRALMVHSAEWTPAMLAELGSSNRLSDHKALLRKFGYGVPSFERARASAANNLALIAQREIQPFEKHEKGRLMKECHYFDLPWPSAILESEEYYDKEFSLKIALSYFVEPNPGKSAAIDPSNYQSFGLRFDLKRSSETVGQFKWRINKSERTGIESVPKSGESGQWLFGPNSISAGSLHCDVWKGTGAHLAARNVLCVKPISGWWKERTNPAICERRARYALVLTLDSCGQEIDLHTPISNTIAQLVEIDF
ncbi:S8 family peptidase [Glycocaulis abyssi]|uniref:S8 family peptidase n=1 Tax=Glycocaulis abyssi TaxID=1433403 RepID=A0ABV9NG59_9PROT